MNKFLIATLAVVLTAPNLSATTMPLNHAEPIESVEVNTLKIEQMFPLDKDLVVTFMSLPENPEAFPDSARDAQAQLRAEIEAEEQAARARSVKKQSTKTAKVQKAKAGTMTVIATAYTHTGEQTATGTWPEAGRTIATDPRVIPSGTRLKIKGDDTIYVAEDTGSAIKGNKIDIFMDSAAECDNFGRQPIEIEVLE